MNRDGHIIWSEFILILGMGGMLIYLLRDFGMIDVLYTFLISVGAFLLGCVAPDFDHWRVQKKFHIKWLLNNITKHRGHWHSLIAMGIYGGIISIPCFIMGLEYWYWIVGSGMLGYFTHLLGDQLKKWFTRSDSRNTLRIW